MKALGDKPHMSPQRLANQTWSDYVWSMILKNVSEAKAELSALLEAVSKGEEVLIGKAGVPVARLVRYEGQAEARRPGALKGRLTLAADFDELPEDLAVGFGMKP